MKVWGSFGLSRERKNYVEVAFYRQRRKERLRELIIFILSAVMVYYFVEYGKIPSGLYLTMGFGTAGVFASFIGLWSMLVCGFQFWFLKVIVSNGYGPLPGTPLIAGYSMGIFLGLGLKKFIS